MATKKPAQKPAGRRPAVKSTRKPATKKSPIKTAARAPAKLTPPRLGEVWPGQGGHFVGTIRGRDGRADHHIVVPTDPKAAIKGIYGPNGRLKDAMSYRDGLANTCAMEKAGSQIAKQALVLKIDGHQDFYIASADEAKLAYVNRPDGFPGVDRMWTSTQNEWYDAYAWVQNFDYGYQYNSHKSNEYRAFVVRSIPIQ